MGSLYLGLDPDLNRQVAIKLLRSGLDPGEMRLRFQREIAAVARLRHPNIVTIFESGLHEGEPFLVMEFIPGEALDELIRRRVQRPLVWKLRVLEEICAALAHAHASGIVHRDVKPANIMIDDGDVVKMVDFGIARTSESDLTAEGAIVGTFNYMAPEQVAGRDVDHRTDLFAAGAVMYELLSYERAFPGTVGDGLIVKVLDGQPRALASLCPEIPDDVCDIVARAIEKDPDRRFPDARSMQAALRDARDRLTAPAIAPRPATSESGTVLVPRRPQPAGPLDVGRGGAGSVAAADRQARVTSSGSRTWIAGAALVLAGLAVWLSLRGGWPSPAGNPITRSAPVDAPVAAPPPPTDPREVPSESDRTGGPTSPAVPPPAPKAAGSPAPSAAPEDERSTPGPTPSPAPVSIPAPTTPPTPPPTPISTPIPMPVPASEPTGPAEPPASAAEAAPPVPAPSPSPVPPRSAPAVVVAPPLPDAGRPSDRQQIIDVLTRYAAAMTAKRMDDAASVFQMDPGFARELQNNFNQVRSWRVTADTPSVKVHADSLSAEAAFVMRYDDVEYVARPGQKTRSSTAIAVHLRKVDGRWTIVRLTR